MKSYCIGCQSTILIIVLTFLSSVGVANGADMRYSAQQYQQRQQELVAQAEQEKRKAQHQSALVRRQLLQNKAELEKAVEAARDQVRRLQHETKVLKKQHSALVAKQKKLQQEKEKRTQSLQELVGFVRTTARDAQTLLRHSQLSAVTPERSQQLRPLLAEQRFPGMDDVRHLRDLLLNEMRATGEVQLLTLPILDRKGEQVEAQTLVLGDFSAAYHYRGSAGDETGFLLYSAPSARFFALSVLPSSSVKRQLENYFSGASDAVPLDIGHGASLRQLTYQTDLAEQLRQGGAIVWPIVAIGIVALALIIERLWFLRRNRFDADALLTRLRPLVRDGEWEQSVALCQQDEDKPLPRVLRTGLRYRHVGREDLENGLQEAILGEIPRLERFLSTLAVLASIAPLLGLLGTVTGMINTFQIITFHGTSDPRLMSGGISEALVTTMVGLGVAIPIMLSHSLLSRRVETIIAQLEEKSISFVNMVCQSRLDNSGQK